MASGAYSYADFAIGYTPPISNRRALDFRINHNDIFDNRRLTGLAAVASDGVTPLYWTNTGRSIFFSAPASL